MSRMAAIRHWHSIFSSLNSATSSFLFYFDSSCSLCCVSFSVFVSVFFSTLVVNKRAYFEKNFYQSNNYPT